MARKPKTATTSLSAAISDAISALQSLGEECREVCDNMPESLQSSARYESLSASADALENLSDPDLEVLDAEPLSSLQVTYVLASRSSRAARRDEATGMLQAAVDALSESLNDTEDAEDEALDEGSDLPEAPYDADAVQSLIDELENVISEAENCEFPGMYG
jgi:hypothetical protein